MAQAVISPRGYSYSAALHLVTCVSLYLIADDSQSFALHVAIWCAVCGVKYRRRT